MILLLALAAIAAAWYFSRDTQNDVPAVVGLSLDHAIQNEFRRGMDALRLEARDGAARFAAGKGRGGSFTNI